METSSPDIITSTKPRNQPLNVTTGPAWMLTLVPTWNSATIDMIMKANPNVPHLVTSVAQRTEPNQWVHTNHVWPLKMWEAGKTFILCITNAFTKFVKIVAPPNNEAAAMSLAIFDHFGRQSRKRILCWIIWGSVPPVRTHKSQNHRWALTVQQSG